MYGDVYVSAVGWCEVCIEAIINTGLNWDFVASTRHDLDKERQDVIYYCGWEPLQYSCALRVLSKSSNNISSISMSMVRCLGITQKLTKVFTALAGE